jgi:hypothetical protein
VPIDADEEGGHLASGSRATRFGGGHKDFRLDRLGVALAVAPAPPVIVAPPTVSAPPVGIAPAAPSVALEFKRSAMRRCRGDAYS